MAVAPNDAILAKAINRLADVHETQLSTIAKALESVSTQLSNLGNGNAATQVGALEGVGMQIKGAAETLASALRSNE